MEDLREKVIGMYTSTLSLKKYYQTKQVTAIKNFNKTAISKITFKTILETTHPIFSKHVPNTIDLEKELPYGIGELIYQIYAEKESLYDLMNSSYKTTNFFTFVSLDPLQKNIPIYRFGGFETGERIVILYLQGFDGKERRLTIHMNTFLSDYREVL